jgi:tetratricopeptide (TPR) repeat protein
VSQQPDAASLLQDAKQNLARLRFQEAKAIASSVIKPDPDKPEPKKPEKAKAFAIRCLAILGLGEDDKAAEGDALSARDLDPKLALAHVGLGTVYWSRALSRSTGGSKRHRDSGEADGLYKSAEAEFRTAVCLDSREAAARDGLGSAYYHDRRLQDAEAEFQLALRLDPAYTSAYFNLGNVYLARQQWSKAESYYRQAISLYSTKAEFHAVLAAALLEQGRRIEAQKEADEAKRLGLPADHWIFKEMARVQ